MTRFDLANRKELVTLDVHEMEINRDRSLDQELIEIEDDIRILQARLDVLSPLERIGTIETARGPCARVNARDGHVALAAFVGSIFLAFVIEYLSANRRVILGPGPRKD